MFQTPSPSPLRASGRALAGGPAPAVPAPSALPPAPPPDSHPDEPQGDAAPSPRPRVLLVTDDAGLVSGLAPIQAVFEVFTLALTGGPTPLRPAGHDLALVDLRSAPSRGLTALEGLRHHAASLPMLALVPPPCAVTPLEALRLGADDFCRSTDPQELLLRLQALMVRRACRPGAELLRVGDLEMDPVARTVRRSGVPVELSTRQFDLLQVLMRRPGQVLSREQIEAEMPVGSRDRASNVVEVHIHHLRRRIGDRQLKTIRGHGYLLKVGP